MIHSTLRERKIRLMEKIKILTAIMEPGGLTLEEFDMMITEMSETHAEIAEINRELQK